MRSKVTVVLLFLNVVLFCYIYYYDLPRINELKTLEARKRVLGPEVASIDSLTRTSSTGALVKLERRGESWWLASPHDWPADRNAIAGIINELQFLEHETSFAVADLIASNQTLADFGLVEPAITLAFTSAGKSYTLKIGDDTRIGKRLYVLSPDGAVIHVVGRSLAETVGLPLDQLRAGSIFTIPVFEVRSLNVQTAPPSSLKVRLRSSAGRWNFETPILARASKSAVEVTINALNALTAKNFLEPRDTDLERTGLNSPVLRVTLEGNARRETLLLGGAAAAGEYFAKIEDKTVVFTVAVATPLLDVLRTAQETLRDPRVLDFGPDAVTTLTIAAPGQPELTLQRLEEDAREQGWQAVVRVSGQTPLTTAADSAVVTEVLQKISQLAARKFLSDAPATADLENLGFNRPERELTLGLSSGGGPRGTEPSTLTLRIGISPDKPGEAFARVTNAPYVYSILPDILDATPVLARHYRQRVLRELPESARITVLKLTELSGNQIRWNANNEVALTPESLASAKLPDPVRLALGTLLGQMRTLRAKRYTADSFSPDQADTAQGPRPWKYRLETSITFAGGSGTAQNSSSILFLTDRLDGTTLVAGTAEFGGVVFEVPQEMLDAIFALTYAEKNDPGPPIVTPTAPPKPAETTPPAVTGKP
ncbi:MAG: DUF4340 domain-containing protein [Lacunisphaera sp.]|nr:DUF4340 domain-containing protein [Lacunisphaera sp.]